MNILKGTIHEAESHMLHWYRSGKPDDSGRRNGVRLGQYLWNMMGKDDCSWPELFYIEEPSHAQKLVRTYFISQEALS